MSQWTRWRQVATGSYWSDDHLDWNGPACYELALAGPRGGNLQIVYVGETVNERARIAAYASHGSHLHRELAEHLAAGWSLFYRAQSTVTKQQALRLQNSLLARYKYPWNIARNLAD